MELRNLEEILGLITKTKDMHLKIASWNARILEIKISSKKKTMMNKAVWLKHALGADIICIQEAFSSPLLLGINFGPD